MDYFSKISSKFLHFTICRLHAGNQLQNKKVTLLDVDAIIGLLHFLPIDTHLLFNDD